MIRSPHPAPHEVTTSEAHVRAVAAKVGADAVPAGAYLYAVRKVPLLRQPLVYAARIEVQP